MNCFALTYVKEHEFDTFVHSGRKTTGKLEIQILVISYSALFFPNSSIPIKFNDYPSQEIIHLYFVSPLS